MRFVKKLFPVLSAAMILQATGVATAVADGDLELLGTYASGAAFDSGGAEIATYSNTSGLLYVVNSDVGEIDVLNISDPSNPLLSFTIAAQPGNGGITSVASHGSLLAASVENAESQERGTVEIYDVFTGALLRTFSVGVLPDMLTFSPDGNYLLVANEGEPDPCNESDPEGSISIIDLRRGLNRARVRTAGFRRWNRRKRFLQRSGVRISDLGLSRPTTVAQDLEPEFVAVSENSRFAYVTLQENNAIAIVHLRTGRVIAIRPLGKKDHSLQENAIDASNRDDDIAIRPWPVHGLFMPDSIAGFRTRGRQFYLIANEGDSREYESEEGDVCYVDETRVKDLVLSLEHFPNAAELQQDENLGRLKVTTTSSTNKNGEVTELESFGGRSFSILTSTGRMIYDSGSDFERLTAAIYPDNFNASDDDNDFDDRSDDKGPEPEGVTVGAIGDRIFAFIGLERIGGVVMYEVTNPRNPTLITYANNRNFSEDPETGNPGDLSPEGLVFIPAEESPNGDPLLVLANEVSGTTSIFAVRTER